MVKKIKQVASKQFAHALTNPVVGEWLDTIDGKSYRYRVEVRDRWNMHLTSFVGVLSLNSTGFVIEGDAGNYVTILSSRAKKVSHMRESGYHSFTIVIKGGVTFDMAMIQ